VSNRRTNEADVPFFDDVRHRQAVAAIAHGDLADQAKMAGDQGVRRGAIALFPHQAGKRGLLFRLSMGKRRIVSKY